VVEEVVEVVEVVEKAPAPAAPVVPKRPQRFSRAVAAHPAPAPAPAPAPSPPPIQEETAEASDALLYSLAALIVATDSLPAGVDSRNREEYLEDAVFEELFGTTKDAFKNMPAWKKSNLKKKHNLF